MLRFVFSFILLAFVFVGCNKKNTTPAPQAADSSGFTFNALKADKQEIEQGEVTNVIAEVNGNVSYAWTVSSGNIFGNGRQVLFGAGTCCSGEHTITCTVTDAAKKSESRSIILKVREP